MAKGKPGRAQAAMRQARLTEAAAEGRVATAAPTGLLVAEGDSWFDHPLNDVRSVLEDEHGFDLEAVAHKGDTVEHMAYGADQFEGFIRLLEKILKRGDVPDAILLSGGGNDIAGGEFTILINHVRGPWLQPGLFQKGHQNLNANKTASYKDDWANELHPTKSGFRAVAARIAAEI